MLPDSQRPTSTTARPALGGTQLNRGPRGALDRRSPTDHASASRLRTVLATSSASPSRPGPSASTSAIRSAATRASATSQRARLQNAAGHAAAARTRAAGRARRCATSPARCNTNLKRVMRRARPRDAGGDDARGRAEEVRRRHVDDASSCSRRSATCRGAQQRAAGHPRLQQVAASTSKPCRRRPLTGGRCRQPRRRRRLARSHGHRQGTTIGSVLDRASGRLTDGSPGHRSRAARLRIAQARHDPTPSG